MFGFGIYIVLLAFVQGVTEFLPVSSSAHILILPSILDVKDQGLVVDIALHIGSFLAVLFYYRIDILEIIKSLFSKKADKSLFIKIIIASIPAVIFGTFVFLVGINFRNPHIVIFTSVIFGIFLYLSDLFGKKKKLFKDISYKEAFLIGISQAFAIIPGVSRSGITTTSMLFLNYKREDALKFSFLISLPLIFLAGVGGVLKFVNEPQTINVLTLFITILLSFIFSLLAIRFMISWVKTSSFKVFALYRIALGVVLYFFLK